MTTDKILAIEGGKPYRDTLLPYARHQIEQDDIAAVTQVLQSDWITTGPNVAKFEKALSERVGAQYAVAVSSGTAALHAAVFAAGIKAGNEVIVPAMTFAASANCVRYQGGTVVFADVRPDTLTLDPAKVERLITQKTRAIITVDYAGQPSDIDDLKYLAEKHNLTLIEDASHALGAQYRSREVGAIADLTTFSFHPVKHITTGEGGMVTTNNPHYAAKMRHFRNHGITANPRQREEKSSWYYQMEHLGYNYRLTDFQCALGTTQLEKLDHFLSRRREIVTQYRDAFHTIKEIEPIDELHDRKSAWHLFVVRLDLQALTVDRGQIFRALRAENIGVNVHYIPVPWHPYYQSLGYNKGQWPIAEKAYEQILTLPLFPAMNQKDIDDVIGAVKKVINAYRR